MDSREFAEWKAYYRLEPFGPRRDNMHAAILAAVFVNSQIADKDKAVTPDAFMLGETDKPKQRKQTDAEIIAAFKKASGNT